jgi:HSP20 family protein
MDSLTREIAHLQQDMNNLFEHWGGQRTLQDYEEPRCDLNVSDNEIVATLDLPGVNKEDIYVNVTDDALQVKAERQTKEAREEKGRYTWERTYNGFYRYLRLPEEIDGREAAATYKNGVLQVHMPLKERKPKTEVKVQ